MGRVIGTLVVILVLFAIISNPRGSAATTRNGLSNLGDAGHQVVLFLTSVVNNLGGTTSSSTSSSTGSSTSSSTSTHVYPRGGVATGDGSTPTPR
jgi:hypothetical protein